MQKNSLNKVKMSSLTESDFVKICRCCLSSQKQGMVLLNVRELYMLGAITSVQFIENDTLPKQICSQCSTKMRVINNFAELCRESNKKLSKILNKRRKLPLIQKPLTQKLLIQKPLTQKVLIPKPIIQKPLIQKPLIQKLILPKPLILNKTAPPKVENEIQFVVVKNEDLPNDFLNETQENSNEEVCDTKNTIVIEEQDPISVNDLKEIVPKERKKIYKKVKIKNQVCEKCGKCFSRPVLLRNHLLAHLKREERLKNKIVKPPKQPKVKKIIVKTAKGLYRCFTCKEKFKTADLRNQHYESSETCKPRQYVCDVCGKSFKLGSSLKVHKNTHSEERNYSCTMCGKTFKNYCNLRWHERMHRKAEQIKHFCSFCGKGFILACTLKLHEETHTETGSFDCNTCDKHFTSKLKFQTHPCQKIKNPNGYHCSTCGSTYSSKHYLEAHIRIHTGEKPHKCPHCPRTFRLRLSLEQHLRIHLNIKPFKCSLCDKSFRQVAHLNTHKLSHSGAKNYQCEICKNKYVSSANLRLHMTIHTGDKPIKCPHCGEGFAHYKARRTHVHQVHGISTPKEVLIKVGDD